MNQNIDFSKVTPIESMFGEDFEQAQELVALFEEAELYLSSFGWCDRIKRAYFGLGVSAFIGIFLFEIEPTDDSVARFHWVVSGDVPSACITTTDCPNPAFALRKYITQMKGWCNTVLDGYAEAPVFEVDTTGKVVGIGDLMDRISLLDKVILDQYRKELV